jgi:hypothetical protein
MSEANREPLPLHCLKCLVPMVAGVALEDVLTGIGDFYASDDVVTVSPSGRVRMVPCWKCPTCGRSVTQ